MQPSPQKNYILEHTPNAVIPAKAGIQSYNEPPLAVLLLLGPRIREDDDIFKSKSI